MDFSPREIQADIVQGFHAGKSLRDRVQLQDCLVVRHPFTLPKGVSGGLAAGHKWFLDPYSLGRNSAGIWSSPIHHQSERFGLVSC